MAYVADYTTVSNVAKATTLVFTTALLPVHAIDDYIVLGVTSEAEAATTHTATAGWTQIGTTVGSGTTAVGLYSSMWYKKCASAAESCTITLSVTNASHGHAFLIKDADLTTFLDGTPSAVYTATTVSQFNSASITTTNADSLLLYYVGIDSTTTTPTMCHTAPGPIHFLDSSDNGGTVITAGNKVMAGGCAGWYIQRTAGATPTPAWNASLVMARTAFTVGIRHKSGGLIPAYIDDSVAIGTKLMDGHWWASATTRNNENFKATPLSVTSWITHLGTLTGTFDAGASAVDTHISPYSASISTTPATSATALTGFELQFPTTSVDMTNGWVVGTFMMSGPKLANFNHGTIKTGGTFVAIGSTTNYRIFQVMARDNLVNTEGRAVFSFQANQTQTQSGQSATPPTISAINRLWVLNRGNTATLTQYCCDFHLINKIVAAGGDSVNPVDSEGLYQIGKFLRVKIIQRQGASGLMPLVPIQIGGGDAINFQIDAGAMQFPRIYDRTKREINYHGANNAIGISYAGKSGDVIKHTNSVVTSESPYYWEINSAATSAAAWDFTGLVVVKGTVTLRPVTTFNKMSFSTCNSISLLGCTLTNSSISGIPATSATLITDASTNIDYCNFDTTTLTAGNHMCSLVDPSIFTYCSFTGSGASGHAIRITTPGTYTLTGNTFVGYGATASTSAAIFNESGGLVTINVAGGGSAPTYRNGAGASTVVNANVQITLTGLQNPSEVRVFNAGTSTEISGTGAESVITGSHAFGVPSGTTVDISILSLDYENTRIKNFSTTADTSVPVSQVLDRQYQNI